jgi:hypothetical protein
MDQASNLTPRAQMSLTAGLFYQFRKSIKALKMFAVIDVGALRALAVHSTIEQRSAVIARKLSNGGKQPIAIDVAAKTPVYRGCALGLPLIL